MAKAGKNNNNDDEFKGNGIEFWSSNALYFTFNSTAKENKFEQTFKHLLFQQQGAISSARSSCHDGLWTSRFWSCTIEESGIKRVKDDKVLNTSS